ncbi:MAG: hypothetical protein WCJ75_13815 [Desulfomonile sp.]
MKRRSLYGRLVKPFYCDIRKKGGNPWGMAGKEKATNDPGIRISINQGRTRTYHKFGEMEVDL